MMSAGKAHSKTGDSKEDRDRVETATRGVKRARPEDESFQHSEFGLSEDGTYRCLVAPFNGTMYVEIRSCAKVCPNTQLSST